MSMHATSGVSDSTALVVDLDGTLLASDVLWESVLVLLKDRPWLAFALPFWLLRGKGYLKREIAQRVSLDVTRLPYREEVVQLLTREAQSGRHVVLATATDAAVAQQIAEHLGLFSEVMASDARTNLSGERKAHRLTARFGKGQFDYLGNDHVDIPAWSAGRQVIVVAPSRWLLWRVRRLFSIERVMAPRSSAVWATVRVMRPHQWVKNLLLFVPLITSHRLLELSLLTQVVASFVAFSLCASAVYIVNDLLDMQSDRLHPRKRRRPFAAGQLAIPVGLTAAPVLFVAAFAVASLALPPAFSGILGVYFVTTTAYSSFLKRQPILDVMVLAGLYAMRVLAGGVAVGIVISPWLLSFALFLFLSLALMKRFSEIKATGSRTLSGRGYRVEDGSWLQAAGLGSAYIAALVLALYISSSDVTILYRDPRILWGLCPVFLYWVTRLWFHAHRGWIEDDPVVAAVKDPASYAVAAIGGLLLLAAI
jgi:4-hydroxybenzoate polyprenyltransferase